MFIVESRQSRYEKVIDTMRMTRTARLAATTAMGLLLFAPVGAAHADEDTPVTPTPPVFTDACGTDEDQVLIPFTQGVDYYLGGVKVNPGVRQINPASPRAQVFTRAADGYVLTAPATWSHTFDEERGCDGEAYVQTGNEAPEEGQSDTTPEQSTPTETEEDTTVVVEPDEDGTTTVVISEDRDELPATGFDSTTVTLLGGAALLGAGALALNGRRLSRQD